MAEPISYVYGIVPAEADASGGPPGIDGAPVRAVREGGLAALVSSLDGDAYAPELVEVRVADVAWLGPRAAAHDAVVVQASDAGAVVPLPMFTVFRSDDSVRAMLRERAAALEALLARAASGREYVVRLYRLDDALAPSLAGLSATVAGLERQAAEATPGQRYLLQRKLDAERRSELRRVGLEAARATWDALAALSLESVADDLPRPVEGAHGAAVLNAAFLVAAARYADFRAALTALTAHWEPLGFRVEFTGPWPPYHFTRGAIGA